MAVLRLGIRRAALLPLVAIAIGGTASASRAQSLTQDEALALAFPGAEIDRRTAYLGDAELTEASRLAGPDVPVESGVVTYYVARDGGTPVGVAYFDVHRVRTLPEVLMIVVGRDGRIRRIESVSFHEPPEYRAPDGWLRQFEGKSGSDDLTLRGSIANLTGASLTAAAASRAARRALALHSIIQPFEEALP